MIYIGLGNAGSKILWDLHSALYGKQRSSARPKPRRVDRFVFGDADFNNSVIYGIRNNGLTKLDPPEGVDLMELDQFWSGGCGVYHIIGEVVANKAREARVVDDVLTGINDEHVTMFLSAGGGTGGGVGDDLSRYLEKKKNVRVIAVLPEVDYPAEGQGNNEINGPDDFQCASAGRLLSKWMNDAFRNQGKARRRDLVVVSNSVLANIPKDMSYNVAVGQLNSYIGDLSMLLTSVADEYPPQERITTVGLGLGRLQGGEDSVGQVAQDLVESALMPIELTRESPSGLSALPVQASMYQSALASLLRQHNADNATWLGDTFRKCQCVDAWLVCRDESVLRRVGNDAEGPLEDRVRTQLETVFGTHVPMPIRIRAGTAFPEEYFPSYDKHNQADVVLLLALDNMVVEDIYRLVAFFIQSSFDWKGGNVNEVATLIDDILCQPMNGSGRVERANEIRQSIVGDDADRDGPYLLRDDREQYPTRFWGNIEHLKNKVLQCLQKPETDFFKRLLTPEQVAGALGFLKEQLWYFQGLDARERA